MFLDKVKEFHNAFGLPVKESFFIPYIDRIRLRRKLIQEEVKEFNEKGISLEARAKELMDIIYVLAGAALEFGIVEPFKAAERVSLRVYNVHSADFGHSAHPNEFQFRTFNDQFSFYTPALASAMGHGNQESAVSSINGLLFEAVGMATAMNLFGLEEKFLEVHRSNMSKTIRSLKEAEAEAEYYTIEKGVPTAPHKAHNGFYLIKRKSDGKVLKPRTYSPAKITI